MLHSQRLNDTPLKCWVIIEEDGKVCCAHCNCMAGLGETCTHVAAVLFYLEALNRIEGEKTCTQGQCSWLLPTSLKSVQYLPIKDIDFTSSWGKKRKLDDMIDGCDVSEERHKLKEGTRPSYDEMASLFANLSVSGAMVGVLSVTPEYSDPYVPKMSLSIFPQPITALHKPEYVILAYHDLLDVCENVSLVLTEEMAKQVELETRQQASSKLWYKYRAGRVTASNMKSVCHTDSANPSQSLIKRICYPELFVFTSKQTEWGKKHETIARERYLKVARVKHQNLQLSENGLYINPKWPFIGASPDGIVKCDCCAEGVVEIKCPYKHRENTIEYAAVNDKQFCLTKQGDLLQLSRSHEYYYQVQTQIFVCDVQYCDFCVFTFSDMDNESTFHIERIQRDDSFWDECVLKSEDFFVTCLLPEVLGHWYTRSSVLSAYPSTSSQLETDNNHEPQLNEDQDCDPEETFCYCNGPEEGNMICCDNGDCLIKWFHLTCLKMKEACIPKGKWYCPDCRKTIKGKGKSKKKL